MASYLQLSRGLKAIIDNSDYDELSAFKWYPRPHKNGSVYVYRKTYKNGGTQFIYLHRHIMAPPDGMVVDHINGDPLDNRRSNLCICTQAENIRKGKLAVKGGVYFCNQTRKWAAKITWDTKRIFLGRFGSELEARQAVWDARAKLAAGASPDTNRISSSTPETGLESGT